MPEHHLTADETIPLASAKNRADPKRRLTCQRFEDEKCYFNDVRRVGTDGAANTIELPRAQFGARTTPEDMQRYAGGGHYTWSIHREGVTGIVDRGARDIPGPSIPYDRIGTIDFEAYCREVKYNPPPKPAEAERQIKYNSRDIIIPGGLEPAERAKLLQEQMERIDEDAREAEDSAKEEREDKRRESKEATLGGVMASVLPKLVDGGGGGAALVQIGQAHMGALEAANKRASSAEEAASLLRVELAGERQRVDTRVADAVREANLRADASWQKQVTLLDTTLGDLREALRTERSSHDLLKQQVATKEDNARAEGKRVAGLEYEGLKTTIQTQLTWYKELADTNKGAAERNENLYNTQRALVIQLEHDKATATMATEITKTVREVAAPALRRALGDGSPKELEALRPLLEKLAPHAARLEKHQKLLGVVVGALAPHLDQIAAKVPEAQLARIETLLSELKESTAAEQREFVAILLVAVPMSFGIAMKEVARRKADAAGAGGAPPPANGAPT